MDPKQHERHCLGNSHMWASGRRREIREYRVSAGVGKLSKLGKLGKWAATGNPGIQGVGRCRQVRQIRQVRQVRQVGDDRKSWNTSYWQLG